MINNISFTSIASLLVGVGLVFFIGCESTKRTVNAKGEKVIDSTGLPKSQSAFKPKPKIKSKQEGQMAQKNKDLPSDGVATPDVLSMPFDTIISVEKPGSSYNIFFISGEDTVVYDVLKNNPFNNLDIDVPSYVNNLTYKVYDVLGARISDKVKRQLYISTEYDRFKDFKISYIESAQSVWRNDDFVVLVYSVYTNTGEYTLIGDKSIAIVINKNGEEIQRFENLDIDIKSADITSDGRFIVFNHEGFKAVYDALIDRPPSFEIYEVATKKKIFEESAPEGVLTGGGSIDDADMVRGRFGWKRILINPYEGIYYSKYISRLPKKGTPEWNEWKRINRERKFVRRTKLGTIFRKTSTGEEFLVSNDSTYTTKRKL